MFDSHPAEPKHLLHDLLARNFSQNLTDRYTSAFTSGNPFVIAQLEQRYGRSADEIVTTTGASNAIAMVLRALVEPGEEVLIERPGFDLFDFHARAIGLKVRHFTRPAPDYGIDPDELAATIGPQTKLVIFSNLHNPSGALLEPATLTAIAQVLDRADIHAIVDEVYLGYGPQSRTPSASLLSDRFIAINSMTKLYSLSTLRCGWIVADKTITRRVREISDSFDFGVSNLAHAAAALVLENEAPFVDHCRGVVAEALPVVTRYYGQWREAGLIEGPAPQFGCVSFPRLVGIDDTEAFSEWLAKRSGVIVAPGEYFGAPGHIRISHAKPVPQLIASLDAFTEGLQAYVRDHSGRLTPLPIGQRA